MNERIAPFSVVCRNPVNGYVFLEQRFDLFVQAKAVAEVLRKRGYEPVISDVWMRSFMAPVPFTLRDGEYQWRK